MIQQYFGGGRSGIECGGIGPDVQKTSMMSQKQSKKKEEMRKYLTCSGNEQKAQ
jgi:hypothetical protein